MMWKFELMAGQAAKAWVAREVSRRMALERKKPMVATRKSKR